MSDLNPQQQEALANAEGFSTFEENCHWCGEDVIEGNDCTQGHYTTWLASHQNTKVARVVGIFKDNGWDVKASWEDLHGMGEVTGRMYWVNAEIKRGGNGLSDYRAQVGLRVSFVGRNTTKLQTARFSGVFDDFDAVTWQALEIWAGIRGNREV